MANSDAQKEIYITDNNPQPNLVDDYSTYTYNITFSMLPQSFWFSGVLPIGNHSSDKMIIAQTGVTTKFNIDNLVISTVADNYGSNFTSSLGYTTKASFQITEPLGSSLTTLMHEGFNQLAKLDAANGNDSQQLYNKRENMGPLDLMYLLEVDLVGRRGYEDLGGNDLFNTDADVLSTGTALSKDGSEIFGKYAWPVFLTQFDFDPSNEGTQYNFEVVTANNFIRKLPSSVKKIQTDTFDIEDVTTSGMLRKFVTKINADILELAKAADGKGLRSAAKNNHSIGIELGGKFGDLEKKEDGSVASVNVDVGDKGWHDKVDAIDKIHLDNGIDKTYAKSVAEEMGIKTTGEGDQTVRVAKLTFKKGTTIKTAIHRILSLNSNFCTLLSDYKFKTNDPVKKEVKGELEPVYTTNISTTLTAKGDKTPTGGPAFKVQYSVDLKLQAGVVTSNEEKPEAGNTDKKIIDKWGIIKKYDYIFSGLNDQVLEVDLSFPRGQVFLFPEYGGLTPTYLDSPSKISKASDKEAKDKKTSAIVSESSDPDVILKHFEKLQSDLKGAISQVTQDGKDFLEGLKMQTELAKNPAGAIKNINGRLPSSPATVFHKIKAIEAGTSFFDGLFEDLLDFQRNVEEGISEFTEGAGPKLLKDIGTLVKGSAEPFEFVTEFRDSVSGRLESFSTGLDGFAESLGFGDASDLPGIGNIQGVVDKLDDLISTPLDGFSPGSIGGGKFEILTAISDKKGYTYLEELDFSTTGKFEDSEFLEGKVPGEPVKPLKTDPATIPAQHYMTTALSYGETGIPYLVKLGLEIKGDPYWIGSRNYVKDLTRKEPVTLVDKNNKTRRWKPEFTTDRGQTGSAPYDAGSIFFAFRYLFPKEYEHYQEDPDSHTGIMRFGGMDLSYSGYYMLVQVRHKFQSGMFKQELDAVKMTTNPNKVIFSDGSSINTDPGRNTNTADTNTDDNATPTTSDGP